MAKEDSSRCLESHRAASEVTYLPKYLPGEGTSDVFAWLPGDFSGKPAFLCFRMSLCCRGSDGDGDVEGGSGSDVIESEDGFFTESQ